MRLFVLSISATAALFCSAFAQSETATGIDPIKPLRIAVVDFQTCFEKSKIGQKEQAMLEAKQKPMESVLREKLKPINALNSKLNDINYVDLLSPEAESALRRELRTLRQEYTEQQAEFYEELRQTNMIVMLRLRDFVTKASEEVAKANKIDLILTDESVFYNVASIDVSHLIIPVMDEAFEKESKEAKQAASLLDTKS